MADGRFAPSPTGELHLGNLRTALVAWLFARSSGDRFVIRMEDLDRVTSSPQHEARQLADLTALGLDWDGEIVRQSERFDRYDAVIARLAAAGLTYPCYCSRREIREAVSAPHGAAPEGVYPGTCRTLTARERHEREAAGRPPAIRLRTDGQVVAFTDRIAGRVQGVVDDVVLRRNDGVPAYNLAVVLDDAEQGIDEVVRGDDLLLSTPSQIHLGRLLGLAPPTYAHVPLVLGSDGARLAKRHGAVTLSALAAAGVTPSHVVSRLAVSLELAAPGESVTANGLVDRFDPAKLPRQPWVLEPSPLGLGGRPPDREG
ncbi:MAG: tRNA glutamyl-Q(34) synthetase GluQRS [Actinomycetota bacterium]|nr:tRNA glutamyl-Q(34) synthetase GluQRS [Actinomycetota bacterium]